MHKNYVCTSGFTYLGSGLKRPGAKVIDGLNVTRSILQLFHQFSTFTQLVQNSSEPDEMV